MSHSTKLHCHTFLCTFTLLAIFPIVISNFDSITATTTLTGSQTIVSPKEVFELGFFSPGNSKKWYLGIWYKNVHMKAYVWVANRNNPLTSPSRALKISPEDGNIVLVDHPTRNNVIWSSNALHAANNTVAKLLDTGNFILCQENDTRPENYLWQSFDYPSDTLLPGMKLGWDSEEGLSRNITSWKSKDDPSLGDYTYMLEINHHKIPETILMNKQGEIVYRAGPWNGQRFSGLSPMKSKYNFTIKVVINNSEVYYSFDMLNNLSFSRIVVNQTGMFQRYNWIDMKSQWVDFWHRPFDQCDYYGKCRANSMCNRNPPTDCICINGYIQIQENDHQCVKNVTLDYCQNCTFWTMTEVKLPETTNSIVHEGFMSLDNCKSVCNNNCSCSAFTILNYTGEGPRCITWNGDLFDVEEFDESGYGDVLYIKVPISFAGQTPKPRYDSAETKPKPLQNKVAGRRKIIKLACITIGASLLLLGFSLFLLWKTRTQKTKMRSKRKGESQRRIERIDLASTVNSIGETSDKFFWIDHLKEQHASELPLFDFDLVVAATNNFSFQNKLGEGGFGPVYMGKLQGGHEIAVKRLSNSSGQGVEEFKNEVILISKLQHRNLVRLLGCCIEGEEKLIIYEYMSNKSLDAILFDPAKREMLDWATRFNIIQGIARGLLYLHRDSRLRIIHRDLKVSNILLDKDMNPKISDFGLARTVRGPLGLANTNRVVGTYGYMSPEYAMRGIFSEKSDVFSFGVLVLEIISGNKNTNYSHCHYEHLTLLGYAWQLWSEDRVEDFIDQTMANSICPQEAINCMHVGLLCVQEQAADRPTMSSVVLMLSSEADRPQPARPGFTFQSSQCNNNTSAINEATLSLSQGR